MKQRLIADWLDKANERTYQGAFCLYLAALGYRIVHNTRHSPIELGKDIVALGPDNILYAFQLKGDPGGRLTINGWRELTLQLVNLCTSPWPKNEFENALAYQPVLVTNGEVEEETRVAIDQFNTQSFFQGKTRPLQIWERGRLQSGFADLWAPCWPEDNDTVRMLLTSLASDGRDLPDYKRIYSFLDALFEPAKSLGTKQRERFALSAASIVELFLSTSLSQANHFTVLATRHVLRVRLLSEFSAEGEPPASLKAVVDELRTLIISSISDLQTEAQEKLTGGVYVDGYVLADFVNFDFRALLIHSLSALLELEKKRSGAAADTHTEWLLGRIKNPERPMLWGEGAVPQILTLYWFAWNRTADTTAEGILLGLLNALVTQQSSRTPELNLMLPHYEIEEVLERAYSQFVETRSWEQARDEFFRRSQFAYALSMLVARRNWKRTLKDQWRELSKIGCTYVQPDNYSSFVKYRTEEATDVSIYPEPEKQWDDLLKDADGEVPAELVGPLFDDPFSLNLHLILFPFRAIPITLIALDRVYIGPPFRAVS